MAGGGLARVGEALVLVLLSDPGAVVVVEVAAVDGQKAVRRDELDQLVGRHDVEPLRQLLRQERPNHCDHNRSLELSPTCHAHDTRDTHHRRERRGGVPAHTKRKNQGMLVMMV